MADCSCCCDPEEAAALERKTLWILLIINGVMFVAELATGWWAESAALIADALDMLADAFVYAVALFAVGKSRRLQANAATASGVFQVALALGVLVEVVRRFIFGSDPVSLLMMGVGAVALVANVSCLLLIAKHRHGGVHMRASWIFSANDVIANIGVIISGALVMLLGSRLPDLIIGAIISAVVLRGGILILREAGTAKNGCHGQ
jgi:cation diffusion facilitator family transporter